MKNKEDLDVNYLRSILEYRPLSGEFVWLQARNSYGGKIVPGSVAGTINPKSGHREIGIDGCRYQAHRLAWYYVHGVWPKNQVDHINMVPDDNRLSNLREATRTQQRANQHVRKDSATGNKGVDIVKGRYRAQIRYLGKSKHLGIFQSITDASAAYAEAARRLFGEYARAV